MPLNNWKTTAVGIGFGIANYLIGIGGKLPENRRELTTFIASLAMIGLGVVAKDFNVIGGTTKAVDSSGDPLKPTK